MKLIKLAIDELGTVNLGAIDEYERVSERYEFLLTQKSDLQQAKDTLFKSLVRWMKKWLDVLQRLSMRFVISLKRYLKLFLAEDELN